MRKEQGGWMDGGNEWSSPTFVNKTQPGVKSDILAIKAIRFLFALPIWCWCVCAYVCVFKVKVREKVGEMEMEREEWLWWWG